MTEQHTPETIDLTARLRTTLELTPQMSSHRLLCNAAAGQNSDGYTTLTMSDDAAELLAQILVRYNSAAAVQPAGGYELPDVHTLRVEPDHDAAFWDAVALDLMVATEIRPPAQNTALAYSLGKTADR